MLVLTTFASCFAMFCSGMDCSPPLKWALWLGLPTISSNALHIAKCPSWCQLKNFLTLTHFHPTLTTASFYCYRGWCDLQTALWWVYAQQTKEQQDNVHFSMNKNDISSKKLLFEHDMRLEPSLVISYRRFLSLPSWNIPQTAVAAVFFPLQSGTKFNKSYKILLTAHIRACVTLA